jgi:chromosome segregation ATPase
MAERVMVAYVLSVSNRSRGPRAGGKVKAPKKKAKSEFQGRKKHSIPVKEVDKDEVRKRSLESLEHLGNQKFSKEPGGYDQRGWLKSLKTLLDDFEDKIGKESLTEEFQSKRKEIEAEFSKRGDTAHIDAEIESVRKEEADIKAKLKEESERIASRLSAIGGEKTSKAQELAVEKANLDKVHEERKSVSFFSKLVGKSGPPTEPVQKKVDELENGLRMLEEETLNLQTVRKSIEGAKTAGAGIYQDLWTRLEALGTRVTELNVARETKAQLLHEREEATGALRKVIAELKLESPKKDE